MKHTNSSFEATFAEIICVLLIVGQWYNPAYDDRGPQKFNPEYHRSEPDLGRHVNHNRPSTASLPPPQPHQTHDPGQGQPPHPPHHSQVGGYKCIEMINPSPQHALRNTRRCMINCFIWVLDKIVFSHTGKINDNFLFESFDAYFFKIRFCIYFVCTYYLYHWFAVWSTFYFFGSHSRKMPLATAVIRTPVTPQIRSIVTMTPNYGRSLGASQWQQKERGQ